MILLKARAREWGRNKKSPPANWRAEGLLQQACLEGELTAEDNAAGNARVLRDIAKASECAFETRIFNNGINRGEVAVIEHIQEGGVELKVGMLAQLDGLEDGSIANILDGVLHRIARRIAERGAEHRL